MCGPRITYWWSIDSSADGREAWVTDFVRVQVTRVGGAPDPK